MKKEHIRIRVILVRNFALLLALTWPLAAQAGNYVLVDSALYTYPGNSGGNYNANFQWTTNTVSTDTNLVNDNWLVVATDASKPQGYDSAYSYIALEASEQSGTASGKVTAYCGGIATATWYSATGDDDEGIIGFANIANAPGLVGLTGNISFDYYDGPAWVSGDAFVGALLQTDYEETNLLFVNVTNNSSWAYGSFTTNIGYIFLGGEGQWDNDVDPVDGTDFYSGPADAEFTYSISYTNYYGFPDGGVEYLYGTVAMYAYSTAAIGYSDAVDVGGDGEVFSQANMTMMGTAGIQLTKDRDGD